MSLKIQRILSSAKKNTKKGDLKKAGDLYRSVLSIIPDNQEAKKGLLLLEESKSKSPSKKELDNAMRLYSSGLVKESLDSINLLIELHPHQPLLFNFAGACYSQIGPVDNAISCFEKAITLKSDYAEAYYNLGVALQKVKQTDKALKNYQKATSIKHAYPQAHNNAGLIEMNNGDYESAIKSLEWAVAYNPNYAEAFNNLGATYQEIMNYDDALKQFKKATVIDPKYALAHNNLGILFQMLGFQENALESYSKAIEINSNYAEAHKNISSIKKYDERDSQVKIMEKLYSIDSTNNSDKIQLCFALAKVNQDLNKEKDFFKYLNEGNNLQKKELGFSFESYKKIQSNIIDIAKASPSIAKNILDKKNSIKKPLFIVGMPRSGSSLVEQILSSHSEVFGAGEMNNFKNASNPFIEKILQSSSENLTDKNILSIGTEYLNSLDKYSISEKFFTDKMPLNFEYIGLILKAFPEAKIIHVTRDARAICWSIYKHYFSVTGNSWGYDMNDLVNFYSLYVKTMDTWNELFPNKIYEINYEKLINEQKSETKDLLNFCDLKWDDNCLEFHKNTRAVKTASHSQVRKKIYKGSSEAWKKYEAYLKPLIDGLSDY
ncbi:sulfotransferase [Pseudothioglobus sp. nBUS_23]|uniref:sulfotransferase n=1 Tax=Pseudothioglobus sp. nBUS_23 TaxID=3395318 RepID=UPI003EC05A04